MHEEWKPITNFPGYEVSNMGRVRSQERTVTDVFRGKKRMRVISGRELSPNYVGYKRRYLAVNLHNETGAAKRYIHRLVAKHFVPKPKEKNTVHHKDFDPSNNRASNLQWVSQKENLRLSRLHNGANPSGEKAYRAKLTQVQVTEIRSRINGPETQREIADAFGVSQSVISNINTGVTWS